MLTYLAGFIYLFMIGILNATAKHVSINVYIYDVLVFFIMNENIVFYNTPKRRRSFIV